MLIASTFLPLLFVGTCRRGDGMCIAYNGRSVKSGLQTKIPMSEERRSLQHHRCLFGAIEGTLAATFTELEGTSDCIGDCKRADRREHEGSTSSGVGRHVHVCVQGNQVDMLVTE